MFSVKTDVDLKTKIQETAYGGFDDKKCCDIISVYKREPDLKVLLDAVVHFRIDELVGFVLTEGCEYFLLFDNKIYIINQCFEKKWYTGLHKVLKFFDENTPFTCEDLAEWIRRDSPNDELIAAIILDSNRLQGFHNVLIKATASNDYKKAMAKMLNKYNLILPEELIEFVWKSDVILRHVINDSDAFGKLIEIIKSDYKQIEMLQNTLQTSHDDLRYALYGMLRYELNGNVDETYESTFMELFRIFTQHTADLNVADDYNTRLGYFIGQACYLRETFGILPATAMMIWDKISNIQPVDRV